ncbi:MAG: hypothetical protein D6746_01480, partial [Bacteroidetes bacterium]
QRPSDRPRDAEPRGGLNPRVAAHDKWRRIEALRRVKQFVVAYREAYERWKRGVREVVSLPARMRCVCIKASPSPTRLDVRHRARKDRGS